MALTMAAWLILCLSICHCETSLGANGPRKAAELPVAEGELLDYLNKARRLIQDKQYTQAIAILQALSTRKDAGFVPQKNRGSYRSFQSEILHMLRSMGPDGLKIYRQLYDPQAGQLLLQARQDKDRQALQRLCSEFLISSYGLEGLDLQAQWLWDEGAFSHAGRLWMQAADLSESGNQRAVYWAKAAIALHAAGQSDQAARIKGLLEAKASKARGVIGGRDRNLLEYVSEMLTRLSPGQQKRIPVAVTDWLGFGSVPDGCFRMGESNVALFPVWRVVGPLRSAKDTQQTVPLALKEHCNLFEMKKTVSRVRLTQGHASWQVKQKGGRLDVDLSTLAATVHPVVVGKLILIRTSNDVAAYDLEKAIRDGGAFNRPVWRSGAFAMTAERNLLSASAGRLVGVWGDAGRYCLTVSGDLVYCLGEFSPVQDAHFVAPGSSKGRLPGSSSLRAISISGRGKVVWTVGGGKGEDLVLKQGCFLSAPTVLGRRAYTKVLYRGVYYLVCLDSRTGKLIWKSGIAQTPEVDNGGHFSQGTHKAFFYTGGGVAVADGIVVATTNSGVVAAFDAETGQAVWAHQYVSVFQRKANSEKLIESVVTRSVNPIIISKGRVVCLPPDSANALCLRLSNGQPLWKHHKSRGQTLLSAIDSERVLLSNPGLSVVRISDGCILSPPYESADLGVHGRPAVTANTVLASAKGKLVTMSLKDYSFKESPITSAQCILGNLVSVRSKLVAANPLGLALYCNFEQTYQKQSDSIEKADGRSRALAQWKRGKLCMAAGQLDRARKDLEAALAWAEKKKDQKFITDVKPSLYDMHIQLGNSCDSYEEMLEHFRLAGDYAHSDQERMENLIRMLRCRQRMVESLEASRKKAELAGQPLVAARLLKERDGVLASLLEQSIELRSKYRHRTVVEYPIGKEAKGKILDPMSLPQLKIGSWVTESLIPQLLNTYGRECFAEQDQAAQQALVEAVSRKSAGAILRVAEQWPNSIWATQAYFEAASACYAQAVRHPGRVYETELIAANRYLGRIDGSCDDPILQARVLAARTVVYRKLGMEICASALLKKLKGYLVRHGLNMQESIEFGQGQLGSYSALLEGLVDDTVSADRRDDLGISSPLKLLDSTLGKDAWVLRDYQGRVAVRKGTHVLMQKHKSVMWVDLAAWPSETAIVWRSEPLHLAFEPTTKPASRQPLRRRHPILASVDESLQVAAVFNSERAVGLDLSSGKVLWQTYLKDKVTGQLKTVVAGEGRLILVGQDVVCIEISSGKKVWAVSLQGAELKENTVPVIASGMVLLRTTYGRALMCLDLNNSGKLIKQWEESEPVRGYVSPEGLLVLLRGRKLSVHDPSRVDLRLWWHRCKATDEHDEFLQDPLVLGMGEGLILLSEGAGSPWVDVRTILEGRRLARIRLGDPAKEEFNLVKAIVDGDAVYVVGGASRKRERSGIKGAGAVVRGVKLYKISLADKRCVWRRSLGSPRNRYSISAPIAAGKMLVMSLRDMEKAGYREELKLLDSSGGSIIQDIKMPKVFARPRSAALLWPGKPILLQGGLCVNTSSGVRVYREESDEKE